MRSLGSLRGVGTTAASCALWDRTDRERERGMTYFVHTSTVIVPQKYRALYIICYYPNKRRTKNYSGKVRYSTQ